MNDKKLISQIRKALYLAESVMAYCQGDAWERECTECDRNQFAALKAEIEATLGRTK